MSLTDFSEPQPSLAWSFENSVVDYVTSLPMTVNGSGVSYAAGKYGQAISIQTNSTTVPGANYMSFTSSSTFSASTLCCWVNFNNILTNNYIFQGRLGGTVGGGINLWTRVSGVIVFENGTNQSQTVSGLSNGVWYHLAGVISASTVTLYVNGVAQTPAAVTVSTLFDGGNVGLQYFGTSPAFAAFTGLIDDFRIYNTALTAVQVQSIYTQGGVPASNFRVMPQPALAWSFESSNVDYVTGLSPSFSTTDGALTSIPTFVAGKYNQAINFNNQNAGAGANSYVAYDVSAFNFTSNSSTLSLWLNPSYTYPLSAGSNPYYIHLQGTTYYSFQTETSLLSNISFHTGSSPSLIVGQAAQSGVWNHYCGVFSNVGTTGASNTASYFYLNGTLIGSGNTLSQSFTGLYLASQNGTQHGSWCSIDDLRLFNTALTAAQVQSVYAQQGMPGRAAMVKPPVLSTISARASGAYSLRSLNSVYSGPVVNVRRNSDNAILDFISGASESLSNTQSAVTLDEWLSGTTGNVATWYDQVRSNNFVQVSTVNQPQIVRNAGKWTLFFNRNATPTFYSNMYMTTNQTGIYSIVYNFNVSSTFNTFQTLLGNQFNDNRGFRFDNNAIYGDATASGGRYNQDFLDAAGSYWYLNNQYGSMDVGAAGVPSVVNPNGNNGIYTNSIWNHVIGVANGGMDTFAFNSINSPNTTLTSRTMYGYLSELIMFQTQLSAADCRALYATRYISTTLIPTFTGAPLFSQLSQAAASSVVGAFSLRAINGVTAKAVAVQGRPVAQWPPSAMTSNTSTITGNGITSGVYTASSSAYNSGGGGSVVEYKAFDYNTTTFYESAALSYNNTTGVYIGSNATTIGTTSVLGEWLQIKVPNTMTLRSYDIVGRQDNNFWQSRVPTTFWIAGSTNGTTWSNVHYQSGLTPPQEGITITVPQTSNALPYTYYRLVSNVIGYAGTQRNVIDLASWNLYGDAAVYVTRPTTDFWADSLGNLLTAPVTGQTLENWLGGTLGYAMTWYDQSGRGNNATGIGSTIYKTSNVNMQWAIRSGNLLTVTSPSTFITNTNFTIHSVTRRTTSSQAPGGGGTAQTNQTIYSYTPGNAWPGTGAYNRILALYDFQGNRMAFSSVNATPATYGVIGNTGCGLYSTAGPVDYLAVIWNGTTTQMYYNGSTSASTAAATFGNIPNTNNFYLLGCPAFGSIPLGEFGEIVVFNTALSASDISTLYLAR